jgi:hypothetical protein
VTGRRAARQHELKDVPELVTLYRIVRASGGGRRAGRYREYLRTDAKKKYNYLYLGGVYGGNRRAKAMILGSVYAQAAALKPRAVFAKAATADGLRSLQQASFNNI